MTQCPEGWFRAAMGYAAQEMDGPRRFLPRIRHCTPPGEKLHLNLMKNLLDFEKPIFELQKKLEELKKHPETHSLDLSFEDEIRMIEKKLAETSRQIFSNLTPWQRVQ